MTFNKTQLRVIETTEKYLTSMGIPFVLACINSKTQEVKVIQKGMEKVSQITVAKAIEVEVTRASN